MSSMNESAGVAPRSARWRLRQLTTPAEHRRLISVAGVAFIGGLADAVSLVTVSAAAVGITRGEHTLRAIHIDLSIGVALALAASLALMRLALGWWGAWANARTAAAIVHRHRTGLTHAYIHASWDVWHHMSAGSLQLLSLSHTQVAGAYALSCATQLSAVISITALAGVALVLNPLAAVAVIAIGAVVALLMKPLLLRSRTTGQQEAALLGEVATEVSSIEAALLPITLFDSADAVVGRLRDISLRQAVTYRRSRFLVNTSPLVFQTLITLAIVCGLLAADGVGGTRAAALGGVALVSLRALSYGQALQQATQAVHAQQGFVDELLAEQGRLRAVQVVDGTIETPPLERLRLTSVSVVHPDDRFVLGPLDLDIGRHEFVGIVGTSGSGKTTLLDVLTRLRASASGSVTWNDVPVGSMTAATWALRVGCVSQIPVLMNASVADNVRWFRDLADDDVRRACQQANIADEIVSWPLGYDTPVGGGGAQLSVGQRQRICLARALAGHPDLLVLDEATSALDDASERAIATALANLRGSITVLMVAHRPATLATCDRLLTMREGRLSADA